MRDPRLTRDYRRNREIQHPGDFQHLKIVTDRIHDAFCVTFRCIKRNNEIRCYRRRQIAKESEGEEERERIRLKKRIAIIPLQ